jgi:ferrous-iron efflux pump FieF
MIKDAPDDKAPGLMRLAARASLAVAGLLVLVKAVAWFLTGSVALLGSLVDSALDVAASLVNFLAIRTALEPPDAEHRFGHGKAEAIAGLIQSAVILGSAVFLLFESIARLARPAPIEHLELGIGVSIFAIVLTLALVIFQKYVVTRTGSVAVAADRLHYTGDLLLNIAVIAALLITNLGGIGWADGAFGVAIAAYIARTAWSIGRDSVDMLMDKEFEIGEREEIFNLVMGNKEVKGLHELKTRRSGRHAFIQMHIELDPELKLYDAHSIADEVEATVGEAFPNTEILIHTDPLGLEEPYHKGDELD